MIAVQASDSPARAPAFEVRDLAYLVNAFVYPIWYLLGPRGPNDPWILWWLVGAYMAIIPLLVARVPLLRRHREHALLSCSWLSSFQLCGLAVVNQMDPFYAVGSVMSVTIPVLFHRSPKAALQFAVIALVALIAGLWWTQDLRTMGYWGSAVFVLGSGYWWLQTQKRAERRDLAYREELESLVAERTQELRTTNETLRKEIGERQRLQDKLALASKMEGLGRLAGGIAHDYNNLLTAILGSAEYLEGALPASSSELREAQAIRRAGESAARLTGNLLAFSRSSPIDTSVLEPAEVISATLGMLQPFLPPGVRLLIDLDHRDARIRANRGQLEQVILNLVLNARDAMPKGKGGVVAIETRDREENGKWWFVLRVRDTGIGMDAETRARIFDPFFTTKDVGSGMGLGLSIVYAIVERAGGTIAVESTAGEGSQFQIYWPATDEAEALPGRQPAALARTSKSERILVVDDDPAVRRTLCRMLSSHGYVPIEAPGAEQGLRLAIQERADLIVCDVLMPGVTGPEFAKQIRAAGNHVPVMFISGHPERAGMLDSARLRDGWHFLAKPFNASQLADQVRLALEPGPKEATPGA